MSSQLNLPPANTPGAGGPTPAKPAATPAKAVAKPVKAGAQPAAGDAQPADGQAEPKPVPEGRSGAISGWFRDVLAFSTSAIVHCLLVIVLALWVTPVVLPPTPELVTVAPIERDEDELMEELDPNLDPSQEMVLEKQSESMEAAAEIAAAVSVEDIPIQDIMMAEAAYAVPVAAAVDPAEMTASLFNSQMPGDTPGEPSAVVGSYSEAMDRLSYELLAMLSESKVLVVWLFDQSESMKDDQREINSRIQKVYQELGLVEETRDNPLLTSVCSYGQGWDLHTQRPTADFGEISDAIASVPTDPSGEEIMCQAVGKTISAHSRFAGTRQIALILVSDESGNPQDNRQFLEAAINEAKSNRTRVYVLGREAVFAYPYAHIRYTDPETKEVFWRRINRGPETPAPEGLQTNGFYRRYDAHPSGFGPYEQVRLARETGGIFFVLPSLETNLVRGEKRQYELESMRPYLPYLGPRETYLQMVSESPLRTKLVWLIHALNPYDKDIAKWVEMRHRFSFDPQEYAKQVAEEQVKATEYIKFLEQQIKEIDAVENLREQEDSERWRASYDLMRAQLVAYRVRLFEYGLYLEWHKNNFGERIRAIKNKSGPKKSTNWEIKLRKELLSGDKFKDDIARANVLFTDVVNKHPGTPWAARAAYERNRGYGVHLVEERVDPRRANIKLPNL